MTTNPIAIGFDWRQAFDLPAGFFQPGDVVRSEFRRVAGDKDPVAVCQTSVESSRLFLALDGDQTDTTAMRAVAASRTPSLVTNFVVERGTDEIAIGVIVTVPVVLLPTRPRA